MIFHTRRVKKINVQWFDLDIEISKKRIRNIYLYVKPPDGKIKLSAPYHSDLEYIKAFVQSKKDWINKKRNRIISREQVKNVEYVSGETVLFLGTKYTLKITENPLQKNNVHIQDNYIELVLKQQTVSNASALLEQWYRQKMYEQVEPMIEKWGKVMGVKVNDFRLKKMKTRWGTCNPYAQRIWLNTELIKKPLPCIEYVLVHEMAHLLEPSHNHRFKALMTQFLPAWKKLEKELNDMSVCL